VTQSYAVQYVDIVVLTILATLTILLLLLVVVVVVVVMTIFIPSFRFENMCPTFRITGLLDLFQRLVF
jgi:hypothetical protein